MKKYKFQRIKLSALIALCTCLMSFTSNKQSIPYTQTDILVIGGGTSGTIAAIQAARIGCSTILIEAGSQLGGTMTTGGVPFPGLFHAWGKQIISGIGWELVKETVEMNNSKMPNFSKPYGKAHWRHQIKINGYLYALLAEEKCLQAGVDIHYYEIPTQVKKIADGWLVTIVGKGTEYIIKTRQIIDCTGDAAVVALAGYDRLKEEVPQPGTLMFEMEGCDYKTLDEKVVKQRYDEAIAKGTLLKIDSYNGVKAMTQARPGLSVQHVLNANSSTSALHTKSNIEGRKSLMRILRFIKSLPGCENARLKGMQPETAVRESYRIDGLYQITHEDYIGGRIFEDALSYSYYPIDLHVEEGVTPKHLVDSAVATVPLRALIPKKSTNMIVAGRCVSSDQLANSALRVQASCMGMGQVAGAVAGVACKTNTSPAQVPLNEVRKILKEHGAIVPQK